MENLFTHLEQVVLRMDSRFCTEDGHLLKNNVVEAALALDPQLLHYLLADEKLKKQFFSEVDGLLVFDKIKFQRFVMNKQFLPDSYTAFKNKVGLTNENGEFLSESREVVLSWPYKDCMLEGGQTKEDAKRQEIFWNETLAPDEINRLTEPKALCHFRRYDSKGEHEATELHSDDNLIIKGNNLLALYSLRERFRNSVKLIYIDPPYNTGNDSFGYNDSFNHSTWLTFMKNRLEVAKELLRNDGMIFMSINHIELGYVLVLMDLVFGKENKLPISTLKVGTTASYRAINECPVNVTEYVIGYTKNPQTKANKVYREAQYTEDYSHVIINKSEPVENWKVVPIMEAVQLENGFFSIDDTKKKLGNAWSQYKYQLMCDFAMKHKDSVVSLNTLQKPSPSVAKIVQESKNNPNKVYEIEREGLNSIYCYNGRSLAFFSSKFREVNGKLQPSEILTNLWSDISFLGIGPEGAVTLANGKKPEALIERIILLSTSKNDLVLDFHLGSGTTAAVAHKMGRQYIGVEQLDYKENDSVVRLQNVINGDPSGVSNSNHWQGGGSFVYCELAQANQQLVEEIMAATEPFALKEMWERLQEKGFLSYKVSPKMFDEGAETFKDLSLDDQKRFLIECLDKNMLYIPFADIDDTHFALTENDKLLTRQFYARR